MEHHKANKDTNYLYLKTSDEPVGIGSLTPNGIVTRVDFPRIYTTDQFYDSTVPVSLTPLLIMDAPEGYSKYTADRWQEFEVLKKNAIPFHSNEQVYEYLKMKGIKPEAEMLIEFDGEVEIKYMIASDDSLGNPTRWTEYTEFSYNRCIGPHKRKVALIKQPVQESEDIRDALSKLAWKTWEEDQKINPNAVNPHAYTYGFKAGYNAAKVIFELLHNTSK